ncbi:MAG: C39 family peptidase [Chloroflexota bacterium]
MKVRGLVALVGCLALAACGAQVSQPVDPSSGHAALVSSSQVSARRDAASPGGGSAGQTVPAAAIARADATAPAAGQVVAGVAGSIGAAVNDGLTVKGPALTAAAVSGSAGAPEANGASAGAAGTSAAMGTAAAPRVPVAPTPSAFQLGPLQYIRQTLNNCGPAAIAEVLRYWGVQQTQGQAQAALRPDGNNRGMWPYPVPGYLKTLGMDGLMGVSGTDTLVKAMVSNGFPVIVSQWVSATDHVGHYREIEGFDDARGVFISTDSYLGPNHEISYPEFDQIWTGNQRFMVVYPPAKQALLDAVQATAGWNKAAAYEAELAHPFRTPPVAAMHVGFVPKAGFLALNSAWDDVQLNQLDQAAANIAQAKSQGASSLMVGWLTSALAVAQSSPAS